MAENERRPPVPAEEVFGDHLIAPLPEGTQLEAAYILVKLDDGDWCARQVGKSSYNRVEFLGQLTSYTHWLLQDEASGWFIDDDDTPAGEPS